MTLKLILSTIFTPLFPENENTLQGAEDDPKHFPLFLTQAVFPQSLDLQLQTL